jgi:hypothetical protein
VGEPQGSLCASEGSWGRFCVLWVVRIISMRGRKLSRKVGLAGATPTSVIDSVSATIVGLRMETTRH